MSCCLRRGGERTGGGEWRGTKSPKNSDEQKKDIYCVNAWQEPACRLLLVHVPDILADGYAQVQAKTADNKHFMIKRRAGAGTGKMQIK